MYCVSVIIPVCNEEKNIPLIYEALYTLWEEKLKDFFALEIIFVDDGSVDHSMMLIAEIARIDPRVRSIEFSRNFGKEIATTAGIHACTGDACIMMDADMQHPVDVIPAFLLKWREGDEVVIGVRERSESDGILKRWGSWFFYKIMRMISDVPIISHATDFRLLDRVVIDAFNELPERNRITRGLIDWLGFRRGIVQFAAGKRLQGEPSYSTLKLVQLAVTSMISLSLLPLRIAGYLGIFIVFFSVPMGLFMLVDRYTSYTSLQFTGSAILAVILMFLIGIVLICLGLLAFYIGHIYHESQGRPMYIARNRK